MPGDIESLVKFITGLGSSGILILLVYGLLKGWFVTGREHGVLANLYTALQTDLSSMRMELNRLRDRDESQQQEINDLKQQVKEEQAGKAEALRRVEVLTGENEGLRRRVTELERSVGMTGMVKT